MHRAYLPFLLLAAALLAGCQSAEAVAKSRNHPLNPSNVVYVERFDASNAKWVGDHGDHTAEELVMRLDSKLRALLREQGLEPRDAPQGTVPVDGTLVRGTVDVVDAGSGAARYWAGMFGGGQSRFVTTVRLYNGAASSGEPACELEVVGGTKGSGRASYPSLADAEDAAEQIALYVAKNR